jgi:hypothetical protein
MAPPSRPPSFPPSLPLSPAPKSSLLVTYPSTERQEMSVETTSVGVSVFLAFLSFLTLAADAYYVFHCYSLAREMAGKPLKTWEKVVGHLYIWLGHIGPWVFYQLPTQVWKEGREGGRAGRKILCASAIFEGNLFTPPLPSLPSSP